jgi:4-amino-4-deoxy-L-arabinose transferase-like glycosyltransferase
LTIESKNPLTVWNHYRMKDINEIADELYSRKFLIYSIVLLFICWIMLRICFFAGFFGFDDLHYMRYALSWDRIPANHWETRLIFNSLLRLSFYIFGFSEVTAAIPTMFASLVFMYGTFFVVLRICNIYYAFYAGLMAALLVRDIIGTTNMDPLAFANMFIVLGTACILFAKHPRQYLLAGCLLGISVFVHLTSIFYLGMLSLAIWIQRDTDFQWKKSISVMGSGLFTFCLLNFTSFYFWTGDPFYEFKIASSSHIKNSEYLLTLEYNMEWFLWPVKTFIISQSYGILLSITFFFMVTAWKRQPQQIRFICLLTVFYWLWISYGTQTPTRYIPLDHSIRYWYPMALPACILAAKALSELKNRFLRVLYLAGTIGLPLLFLLSSGTWGQNIEITKELMAYAKQHPKTEFVADKYTLDEMYVLNACKSPANVFSLKKFTQPAFFNIPEEKQKNPSDTDIVFLYNEQNIWRTFAAEFKKFVHENVRLTEISEKKYRLITYCLPKSVREKFNWMIRKQPARIGNIVISEEK